MMTIDPSGPGDDKGSLTHKAAVGECVTLARATDLPIRSKHKLLKWFYLDLRASEEVKKGRCGAVPFDMQQC